MVYAKNIEIRWSDLDPNFHLRHSVYYDFGAYSRISFLNEAGITPAVMMQQHIGPVIFREEAVFKKEIKFGDSISINIQLEKYTSNFTKWTMKHELWKNGDVLAAVITIDGAWLDTSIRKLTMPGQQIVAAFDSIPKTENFSFSS
jgi:acyl-CoA thioester hydrolase